MADDLAHRPKVLSVEEIEILINTEDRKAIDKMTLLYLNRLAYAQEQSNEAFVEHKTKEEAWQASLAAIGGLNAITERAEFVDELIRQSRDRRAMMQKVSQSSLTWALLAFFGFLATATWEHIVRFIKHKLGG